MEHLHPDLHQGVQHTVTARVANLTLPTVIGYPVARQAMDRLPTYLNSSPQYRKLC